jgi:hypothetical protein
MIQFYAVFVCQIFSQFGTSIDSLLRMENQDAQLGTPYKEAMSRLAAFDEIERYKHVFLNDDLSSRLWHLRIELSNDEPFTAAMLARELQGMLGQMIISLSKRKFAYIPSPNSDYFEQDHLFGEEVYAEFVDARIDIKESGNSFAAALYTACVFHLMRVAEFGLRSLAASVGVTIKHTGSMIPLEYGEWDQIITEIQKRIDGARSLPRNQERERQLELYAEANQHCLFMKDIFRNTVSHARKAYNDVEAESAMRRVKDFMQFLANAKGSVR